MNHIKEEDWELIIQVIDGEMDEQDPAFIEWLHAHTDNVLLFENLKKLKVQTAISQKHAEFEAKKPAMWETVKMHTASPVKKINKFWRYAAAVLIPLALITTWNLYNNNKENNSNNTLATNTLQSAKATLHLSNGTTINLDETKYIQEKDGTQVNAQSNDGLHYLQNVVKSASPVYNTLVTAKGGAYLVTLSDGTRVWLNAVSSLVYPTQFTGEKREVELNGEAYFDVAKNSRQPFIVKTSSSQVQVTGTQFNISAYEGEFTIATLEEGGINFSGIENASKATRLVPSQQAILNQQTGQITVQKVDTEIFTSWKKGTLFFENERLETLLKKLDRWYDFDISFAEPQLKELRFTGKSDKSMSIAYILQLVSHTTDVKFDIKGKRVAVLHK